MGLAGALIALAASDSASSTGDRIALLAEAESLLTAAYDAIQPNVKDGSERAAAGRFVRLYETWEALSPDTGKGALAADWKKKHAVLPSFDNTRAPSGMGSK